MFTRLEFEWLQDHPPLHMLDPAYLWLPTGEERRRRPTPCRLPARTSPRIACPPFDSAGQ